MREREREKERGREREGPRGSQVKPSEVKWGRGTDAMALTPYSK